MGILRALTAVAVESEAAEDGHARAAHAVARALAAQMTAVEGDDGDDAPSPREAVDMTDATVVSAVLRTALLEVQQSNGRGGTPATHDATVAVAAAVADVNALYVRTAAAAATTAGGGGAARLAAAAVATSSQPQHVRALVWGGGSAAQLEASTAAAVAHAAAGVLPVDSVLRLGVPPSPPLPPLLQPTQAGLAVSTAEDGDDDDELLLLLLLLPAALVIGLAAIQVYSLVWGGPCCVPCVVTLKRRSQRERGDKAPTTHDDDVQEFVSHRESAKVHPLYAPGNVTVPSCM